MTRYGLASKSSPNRLWMPALPTLDRTPADEWPDRLKSSRPRHARAGGFSLIILCGMSRLQNGWAIGCSRLLRLKGASRRACAERRHGRGHLDDPRHGLTSHASSPTAMSTVFAILTLTNRVVASSPNAVRLRPACHGSLGGSRAAAMASSSCCSTTANPAAYQQFGKKVAVPPETCAALIHLGSISGRGRWPGGQGSARRGTPRAKKERLPQ